MYISIYSVHMPCVTQIYLFTILKSTKYFLFFCWDINFLFFILICLFERERGEWREEAEGEERSQADSTLNVGQPRDLDNPEITSWAKTKSQSPNWLPQHINFPKDVCKILYPYDIFSLLFNFSNLNFILNFISYRFLFL